MRNQFNSPTPRLPHSGWRIRGRRRRSDESTMLTAGNSSNSCILYTRSRTYYFRRCKGVTTIDCLPDDLLSLILVRLEASYLYDNARPVSRRWSCLITSNAFRKSDLQHSAYGLLVCDRFGGGHPMLLTSTGGKIKKCELSYMCKTRLSGSFNGLAMEIQYDASDQYVLHILNPATKQPFVLPPFPFHNCEQMFSGTFGVAYALHSGHYKVSLSYIAEMGDYVAWGLAILTVGVDTSWRFLPVEHFPKAWRSMLSLSPLITEGYMHWAEGNGTEFLTLDVENEILTICHVPLDPYDYLNSSWVFLSTGSSLTALVAHENLVWEIWVMEQGTKEWRKRPDDINFGGLERLFKDICGGQMEILVPLGWINYPQVLAFYFRGRSMSPISICYNLQTFQIDFLDFKIACAMFHVVVHKSSLICLT